ETLKTFCDLCETGSFSRAARLNFVTQSAVSQQLRALERHYGQRLIDRAARRSLQLTDAGKVLLGEARAVVERLAALEDRLRPRTDGIGRPETNALGYRLGPHTR